MKREFFIKKRNELLARMPLNAICIIQCNDAMPRNGDLFFPFRQNSDFFYLTGINQEESTLVLWKGATNIDFKELLFIVRATEHMTIWQGEKLNLKQAHDCSGIQDIVFNDEQEEILNTLLNNSMICLFNTNENPRFKSEVPSKDARFIEKIKLSFSWLKFQSVAPLLKAMRIIKDDEEIKQIRKACSITGMAFNAILKNIHTMRNEAEVEALIAKIFIENGAKHAFETIAAGGKSACYLHYIFNNKELNPNDLILIDFGAEYSNYASDCTRTIPIGGLFSNRQKELYAAVYNTLNFAMNLIKPGISINAIQTKVIEYIDNVLIELGFYTIHDRLKQDPINPLYKKYFMHGISHFMGLDVHDYGTKDELLVPGMVLSCEPGIYILDEGIGIRLENTMLVTTDGCENLTSHIPVDPQDLEFLLKRSK